MSVAHTTASNALANATMRPSPMFFTSSPPRAATASRSRRKCVRRTSSLASSPSRVKSSVDPTRSVKKKVGGPPFSPPPARRPPRLPPGCTSARAPLANTEFPRGSQTFPPGRRRRGVATGTPNPPHTPPPPPNIASRSAQSLVRLKNALTTARSWQAMNGTPRSSPPTANRPAPRAPDRVGASLSRVRAQRRPIRRRAG